MSSEEFSLGANAIEEIERLNRAAILMIRAAMDHIERLGYFREDYSLEATDGTYPYSIILRGKPVFKVDVKTDELSSGPPRIYLHGDWIKRPKHRTWFRRFLSFFYEEADA